MEQPVELRYVWTAEELFAATRWHYRQLVRPALRWCIHLLAGLVMILGLLLMLIVLNPIVPCDCHPAGEIIAAVAIGVGLAWFVLPKPYLRWCVRREFARFPEQHHAIEFRISRERIAHTTRVSEGSTTWDAYVKVVESPEGLLLYMTRYLFKWFPRRWFANDGEFEKVARMAREKVPCFQQLR